MERETWTQQIWGKECDGGPFLKHFLSHLDPLELKQDWIRGKILAIGVSESIPERTLFTSRESSFTSFREGIDTVHCCDDYMLGFFNCPFNEPCVNTLFQDKLPKPKPHTIYYEQTSSYGFLEKVKRSKIGNFDTVLMFRIANLGEQIHNLGLIKEIATYMKKGSYFICSGGRFPDEIPNDFFEPLKAIRVEKLSEFNDGYLCHNNFGVVMQKQ